ncbi:MULTISPECIES: hypothetical protein [Rhodococcus]|uniref:hypothetical protein n=1 Tax=Rhodococcus TaxID=1827 RepID=UPI0013A5743D|nr:MULTISPECIES: hypothetical protein [Rhodococcus]QTJ64189.1 hypothetical protein HYG77_22360 [Rhodococcus sp. ZPP]
MTASALGGGETVVEALRFAADELARCCLHALTAATGLSTREAVQRLVQVTMDGWRPAR